MSMIRLVVTNSYVFNKRLLEYKEAILDSPVNAILACEAQHLGTLLDYNRFAAPNHMNSKAKEVAVYLHKNHTAELITVRRLTNHMGNIYGHDRWVVEVRFVLNDKKFALFAVHANAQSIDPRSANAKENRKLHRKLEKMMEAAEREGWEPIAGGDWNRGRTARGPGTPFNLAKRLGFKLKLNVIDGVVYSAAAKLSKWEVKDAPGSNHKMVYVGLVY